MVKEKALAKISFVTNMRGGGFDYHAAVDALVDNIQSGEFARLSDDMFDGLPKKLVVTIESYDSDTEQAVLERLENNLVERG